MTVTIPDAPSFQEAIALTNKLIKAAADSNEDLDQGAIAKLTGSVNGSRGFFVSYLTVEESPAAQPTEPVLAALASNPETVNDILVKNVVMAAAMTVTHDRNGDQAMVAASQRTSDRSAAHVNALLARTEATADLEVRVRTMGQALTHGTGDYADFLDKWNYDAEQRIEMAKAIAAIMDDLG
ncbi:MAG: hypothetical protein AAF685_06785 [Cyanobacteria bacterium P01_C01_bin.89]